MIYASGEMLLSRKSTIMAIAVMSLLTLATCICQRKTMQLELAQKDQARAAIQKSARTLKIF
jgi:hypothetical protein